MKRKEWNEGLNHIDSDLVQKYVEQKDMLIQKNKKTKGIYIRFAAVISCLALIAGAIVLVPMMRKDNPAVNPNLGSNAETNHGSAVTDRSDMPIKNVQAPSDAPQYYGREIMEGGNLSGEINTSGISVTARLLAVLPDTYTFYDDWEQTEFRLLKMETVALLKGKKMTDIFYYIVPSSFMTDFTIFDKFVIVDMGQYGYEHSVLFNKTKSFAEQLDIVLMGYYNVFFDFLGQNFMAFDSDGNLDGRLWGANEHWATSTGWPNYATGRPNENFLNGYTIAQAEEDARDEYEKYQVALLDGITDEAAAALEYIKSFENGLYIPSCDGFKLFYSSNVQLSFRRYINGFTTNERGTIYRNSVFYSKAKFTKQDEENLPDLHSAYKAVISAFENGDINPPHIQKYSEMENTANGILGWYAKTEYGVIGIVRVTWCYLSNKYDLYFDDAYYIIEYGSDECIAIDRDSLLDRFGEYETTFIFDGKYNEYGMIYEVLPVA